MSKRKPHYSTCPTHRANSGWLIPVRECDYCKGYAAGLNAAQEAASTQRCKFKARDWDDAMEAAPAAIDALRGEQQ